MKFALTFKTPDVLYQIIGSQPDHCDEHDSRDYDCGLCDEVDNRSSENIAAIEECAEKFILHSEYITIEFDTEKKTATVKESK